jgi:uncharacterized protein YegL
MKNNFIHICFIIDESGSMIGSESDIIGGFNKLVEEQKEVKDGQCSVSFFSFNDEVKERFIGKDVNEVKPLTKGSLEVCLRSYTNTTLNYSSIYQPSTDLLTEGKETLYEYWPNGCTAMNDGIGIAIDKIGKWLNDMPEEERPSKNLIVIMTDGEENASREYKLAKVQEMIKHQTEKYNWSFIYMGMDITNKKTADDLGISSRSFSSKSSGSVYKNYSNLGNSATMYRCCCDTVTASATMDAYLNTELKNDTALYEAEKGIKIED